MKQERRGGGQGSRAGEHQKKPGRKGSSAEAGQGRSLDRIIGVDKQMRWRTRTKSRRKPTEAEAESNIRQGGARPQPGHPSREVEEGENEDQEQENTKRCRGG